MGSSVRCTAALHRWRLACGAVGFIWSPGVPVVVLTLTQNSPGWIFLMFRRLVRGSCIRIAIHCAYVYKRIGMIMMLTYTYMSDYTYKGTVMVHTWVHDVETEHTWVRVCRCLDCHLTQ
jgi:hypothetical protein